MHVIRLASILEGAGSELLGRVGGWGGSGLLHCINYSDVPSSAMAEAVTVRTYLSANAPPLTFPRSWSTSIA